MKIFFYTLLVLGLFCLNSHTVHGDLKKEKGNLSSFIRDFIKQMPGAIKSVGESLGIVSPEEVDNDKSSVTENPAGDDKVKAIYPGTKWCGDGNYRVDETLKNDLGYFNETDSCCRDHDHCFDFINADEIKYGLLNNGLTTRSHCDCDEKFHTCLSEAGDFVSKQVGFGYFTILGPQCYRLDYPVIQCKKKSWGRCVEYEYDTSKAKVVQWFDNPIYKK